MRRVLECDVSDTITAQRARELVEAATPGESIAAICGRAALVGAARDLARTVIVLEAERAEAMSAYLALDAEWAAAHAEYVAVIAERDALREYHDAREAYDRARPADPLGTWARAFAEGTPLDPEWEAAGKRLDAARAALAALREAAK